MINWQTRIKNKYFWLALIPALCLLVQAVLTPFGYKWDFGVLNDQLAAVVNAAFGVLSILGIVVDPTTASVSDSTQALTYDKPKEADK